MNKNQLRSRVTGMVDSLEEIISNASEQTRELKELIRLRNELKGMVEKIDDGCSVDWPLVIGFMKELIICLYTFHSH